MSSISIDYYWAKPNTPSVVRRQLILLAGELEDMVEPMTVAGEIARIDIQERFTTKTSPDGEPWAKWRLSYVADALAHNTGGIMVRTGATKSAIGSRSAFVPTNAGLFIDTSGIPEWGMWNNFGAERTQGEENKEANIRFRKDYELRDEASFGELPGENFLPPRPFIGITPEAQFKMDAAFYAWFDGEVAFATSSLGKPFFRHAKRGGNLGNVGQFSPIE